MSKLTCSLCKDELDWTPAYLDSYTIANLICTECSNIYSPPTTEIKSKNIEGKKYDQGKPRMDLISYHATKQLADVLGFGAQKYDPWNWSKGIQYSRVISAVERHIGAWKTREDTDPESGLNHLAHALCGLHFLLDYIARDRKDLDDRRPEESLK